ncbi:uncharacterized protein LOC124366463 [Homalodisca vitripennis]|uniref:uncharacterized protein LOC124366463 n=1 Tax=Homalodisca vitripennis TaxID=197043 RepID=UPI001EEC079C|nr:uncharacterized protein LOC124366463 [Homalodisca vitripennis]KAG8320104.1 Phospholipase ddhd1 [Homalodisca vitripennis]
MFYRLEPLVIRDYARIAPLRIWPCNCPTRVPYCNMPLELIDPQEIGVTKETTPTATSTTPKEESAVSPAETPVRDRGWSIWSLMRGPNKNQDGVASPQQMDSPTRGNCLEHRLDYVIKVSGSLGVSARTYINMLSSHTAYWGSEDVAFFILTRTFPELDQLVDTSAVPCTETTSGDES